MIALCLVCLSRVIVVGTCVCNLQVPVIRENIIKRCEGKWKQIAKQQMNLFFDPPDEDICQQARKYVLSGWVR